MIRFIKKDSSDNIILFIHGFIGGKNTWKHSEHKLFSELLLEDTELYSQYDVAHFEYYTTLTNISGTLNAVKNIFLSVFTKKTHTSPKNIRIKTIADILKSEISIKLSSYKSLTLIAHSMGGIVAKKYILNPIEGQDIRQFFSFAVPHQGVELASFGKLVTGNPNVNDLAPLSEEVSELNSEWIKTKDIPETIFIIGAYDRLVLRTSSVCIGDSTSEVITLPFDHESICKPEGVDSVIIEAVRKHLKATNSKDKNSFPLQNNNSHELSVRTDSASVCKHASNSLLNLFAADSRNYISNYCNKYPNTKIGRREALEFLLYHALGDNEFLPSLLSRIFKSEEGHDGWLSPYIMNEIRKENIIIIAPPNVIQKAEEHFSQHLISNVQNNYSLVLTSCLGTRDGLGIKAQEETYSFSNLVIGLNSPDLIIAKQFQTKDVLFEAPIEYREFHFLTHRIMGTKLDVLRKLTKLFYNMQRIVDLYSNDNYIQTNVSVNFRFFTEDRPNYTFRGILQTGDFVLFPDGLPVPRPYSTFALIGRNHDIVHALHDEFIRNTSTEEIASKEFVDKLMSKSIHLITTHFKRHNITDVDLEDVRQKLPIYASIPRNYTDKFLDRIIGNLL